MDNENIRDQIASLLPDHEGDNYETPEAEQKKQLEEAEKNITLKNNAATLARIKLNEKRQLKKLEDKQTAASIAEQKRIAENIAEIEAIEESPEAQNFLAQGNSDLAPYSGTTKREVAKLLTSLNINLNLNLTQSDTYNLLSCLLTCNESQLVALYQNKKIPLAIKTVIKRLMDDAKLGNIETVEKLWDRIFGKANKAILDMPQQVASVNQGIIPNTIVSREAYMIIRDTVIGAKND